VKLVAAETPWISINDREMLIAPDVDYTFGHQGTSRHDQPT
jgi:hypothetical protein